MFSISEKPRPTQSHHTPHSKKITTKAPTKETPNTLHHTTKTLKPAPIPSKTTQNTPQKRHFQTQSEKYFENNFQKPCKIHVYNLPLHHRTEQRTTFTTAPPQKTETAMKQQEALITVTRRWRNYNDEKLVKIISEKPIIIRSNLMPHETEVENTDDPSRPALPAILYGMALHRTCEGLLMVPGWQNGGLRQTIGQVAASPSLRPMSLIVVRYGNVAGWYTADTLHRATDEDCPTLHRRGTRGNFDADILLITDSRGRTSLTIVNRDIPFALAEAEHPFI